MKLPGISHMHGTLSTFFLGAFVFRLVCYSSTNKKSCKMIDDQVPTADIIWIFDFKCPFWSKILIRCLATTTNLHMILLKILLVQPKTQLSRYLLSILKTKNVIILHGYLISHKYCKDVFNDASSHILIQCYTPSSLFPHCLPST